MKIDFNKQLLDMDNKSIMEAKDKPLLLDKVCVNAVLSEIPDEKTTGESKLLRFKLAKKIYGASEVEVTAEEIVLIKDRVGKQYLPLIVGQVFEYLEKGK
jgi:hypothetical protein